jgi:2-polyprenyl-3-methyl-5-hydroxy-6-metoxy-1,4-benzoquinol methylase
MREAMSKDVWLNATIEDAGDLILTGYTGEFKDMPVYDEVMSLTKGYEGRSQNALDFGCGVGRNTVALAKDYENVMGFDLPSMLSLVPEENKLSNINYSSDWDSIKSSKFDVVLASLVFQHIDDAELEAYLEDLVKMTDKIVLHSRTWIDHSESKVLPMVEKYFIIDSIEHTQDPNNPIDDHFIAVLKGK